MESLKIQKVNAFKQLVQTARMQRKQPISSEMTEITVGHSCTNVSKKNPHLA